MINQRCWHQEGTTINCWSGTSRTIPIQSINLENTLRQSRPSLGHPINVRELLASGSGTADRCIRFWNTLSGVGLNCVDTGSQVCNLAWSKNCNEIVSTHGYSLNQIVVWRYLTMSKVDMLSGQTFQIVYLATSPNESAVVTGAGDETLRFWQVYPGRRSHNKSNTHSLLFPALPGSVVRQKREQNQQYNTNTNNYEAEKKARTPPSYVRLLIA